MVVLLSLLCLLAAPAMADEPGWRDVPGRLKIEDGVERRGEFVFATGTALAVDSVRSGKAADVARKKSLFRALQGLRMGVTGSLHLEGVTVIRQWEKGRIHFTTVAVPASVVKDRPEPFNDLKRVTHHRDTEDTENENFSQAGRRRPGKRVSRKN